VETTKLNCKTTVMKNLKILRPRRTSSIAILAIALQIVVFPMVARAVKGNKKKIYKLIKIKLTFKQHQLIKHNLTPITNKTALK